MLQNTVAKKMHLCFKKSYADYNSNLENQLSGLLLKVNGAEVWVN
jgi:UDP-N-acetylmuramoyl-L-alanyl-D-glutamate--2,6-diaminopimelate ligase